MPNRLKIGMTASLTGKFASMGSQALAGVKSWIENYNNTNNLNHSKNKDSFHIELVYYDDHSSIKDTKSWYQQLIIKDKVDLLFGPYGSNLTKAASLVACENYRVLWNHGGALVSKSGTKPARLINILSPASSYFHGLLSLMKESSTEPPRLAIFYSGKSLFGKAVAQGAIKQARKLAIPVVVCLQYETSNKDMLTAINSMQPDIIIGAGQIQADINFAATILDSGMSFRAFGLVAAGIQNFQETLGEKADGIYGPSQWEPTANYEVNYGPDNQDLPRILAGTMVKDADYPMAQAYALGLLIQRLIEETATIDETDLLATAKSTDFTTFYGRFRIDPKTYEQVGHQVLTIRWNDGCKSIVWPRSTAQRQPMVFNQ